MLREYFDLWRLYIESVRYDKWCEEHLEEYIDHKFNSGFTSL